MLFIANTKYIFEYYKIDCIVFLQFLYYLQI